MLPTAANPRETLLPPLTSRKKEPHQIITEFKQPPFSPNWGPGPTAGRPGLTESRAPRQGDPAPRRAGPTAGRSGPVETSARAPPGCPLTCRDTHPESPRMITFSSTFFLEVILQAGRKEKARERDRTAEGSPPLGTCTGAAWELRTPAFQPAPRCTWGLDGAQAQHGTRARSTPGSTRRSLQERAAAGTLGRRG